MTLLLAWLRYGLRELAVDRARVLLVVLGVFWGGLSLTVVWSFGQGFHAAMCRAMEASGANLLRLSSGMTTRPFAGLPAGRWIHLQPEDALWVRRDVPGVSAVSLEFRGASDPLEYAGRQFNTFTHGVNPCYGELRYLKAAEGGRFLNEQDEAERRRVIFLGDAVKERVFGSAPAVGAEVKLRGTPFLVVGVLRPKITLSDYNGMDRDKVFIPASTFEALRGPRALNFLVVGLTSSAVDRAVVAELRRAFGLRYRFDPEDLSALEVVNQVEHDRQAYTIIDGTRVLLGFVGVLGLSVALIGVANVMHVLVEERRREIGVQLALGARPRMILCGFFFEGLWLTGLGGGLGLAASTLLLWAFNQLPLGETARGYLGRPEVSLGIAAGVTLLLGVAGCAAGFFPARRAARLDPVAALREE